jgi:hypothetical protein
MPATRQDISKWLDKLFADENLTHMIVKCDTFDAARGDSDCDYPVYVTKDQDVREVERENGDRTMEVYSRNHTKTKQMVERRAFHYD